MTRPPVSPPIADEVNIAVYDRFCEIARENAALAFLATIPRGAEASPSEATYGEVLDEVEAAAAIFRGAGYGHGHRVGLLLGNQPRYFVYLIALNSLGASAVPLNPDASAAELAFIIEHSEVDLLIVSADQHERIAALAIACAKRPPVELEVGRDLPSPSAPALPMNGTAGAREACLLYTSGTTGRPKGCIITNEYFNFIGRFYTGAGGVAELRRGQERILNPLPIFHQNAGIFTFMGAMLSANCFLMTDRFHAHSWWEDVVASRATVIHYLGVMPAVLLKLPDAAVEHRHAVRFGIGAGVEPSLHGAFEERFGIPLVELWGMTETGGGFIASREPREIDTRAFGRPLGREGYDFEFRLVDAEDRDVAPNEQGELLVRRLGANPRLGTFGGYLKDDAATEHVWRGGWFHSGDIVRQAPSGMLCFVDRSKNIIRRSGENIAAAEIETVLMDHEAVSRAAVFAAPDEVREEEVMACIVLEDPTAPRDAMVESLLRHCAERLAYYKVPGWLLFTDSLPTTGTQKVQKFSIFPAGVDPRTTPGALDLRARKRRGPRTEKGISHE